MIRLLATLIVVAPLVAAYPQAQAAQAKPETRAQASQTASKPAAPP